MKQQKNKKSSEWCNFELRNAFAKCDTKGEV